MSMKIDARNVVAFVDGGERLTVTTVEFVDDGVLLEFEGGGALHIPLDTQNKGMMFQSLARGVRLTLKCSTAAPPPDGWPTVH